MSDDAVVQSPDQIAGEPDKEHEYLWERRHALLMRVVVNRMYYQQRRAIFELREGWVKAASLVGGSGAFAAVSSPAAVRVCAVVITVAAMLSLVFEFGRKARDSMQRVSSWALLESEIEGAGQRGFSEAQLNQWFARANQIEQDEPAPNARLMLRCQVRAATALADERVPVLNWWQAHGPIVFVP